jgi:hypothetical protein
MARSSSASRKTVVGIDSNFDDFTLAAFQYRERKVYPYFQRKGFTVDKYQGSGAQRIFVAAGTTDPGVIYLTGVGHGSDPYTFTGQHYDPVFQVGNYTPDEPKGKVVHFLSCKTGLRLGPDFVEHGCLAFFGYADDFLFTSEDQDLFFECDSEIDRAFADGLTAAQVYERVKALFAKRVAAFRARGKQDEAAQLESDFDLLRCPSSTPGGSAWGDPRARLI